MSTAAFRRIGLNDTHVLTRIAEDVFDDAIVPARLAAYLADPQNMMLVALDGDLVVGQCMAVVHTHPDQPTSLYIDNLGVAPSHQRRSIARTLVNAMFAWGRERGCAEGWVLTEPGNAPARALYGGFKGTPVETAVLYHYEL